MVFRRRRCPSLLRLLLVILGLGFLVKRHGNHTDCDCEDEFRAEFRAKRKEFRSKLREAFDVWRENMDAEAEKPAPAAEASGNTGTTSV